MVTHPVIDRHSESKRKILSIKEWRPHLLPVFKNALEVLIEVAPLIVLEQEEEECSGGVTIFQVPSNLFTHSCFYRSTCTVLHLV